MKGWKGDPEYWRVEDGSLVGETTKDKPKLKVNNFLAWADGEVDDFELKLKFRISGSKSANSGVQYRGSRLENGRFLGYQADIDKTGRFIGILFDEGTGRKILCQRGKAVRIDAEGKKNDITKEGVPNAQEILKSIDLEGWNEYHIKAVGNEITQKINGKVTAEVTDEQAEHFDRSGLLGLQLHVGPPMKVEFKDVMLKRLPMAMGHKKIVFVAGKKSHGWGSHEHNAGCLLMADRLNKAAKEAKLPVVTTVYQNGWPADPTAFDNADTVVAFCDGGGRHYLHAHADEFESIMRRGVGLACIHYGVEVPKGPSGQKFLQWVGGYFETNWSVNPHWTAKFEDLPKHPVTNGVKPFEINDEWYYHMRFAPEMTRVTPLLSALPPMSTLKRKDGPHSGNPDVRKAVEAKKPQHVAWAFERGDGKGRGFGFTGGHYHRNWQNDDFRKLVLNAIAWTAHVEVPAEGIKSATPTEEEMDANQDYPKPKPKKEKQEKEMEKTETSFHPPSTDKTGAISDAEFEEIHKSLNPVDEKWKSIPWRTSLLTAQNDAAEANKPIFIWTMDGNPLTCT